MRTLKALSALGASSGTSPLAQYLAMYETKLAETAQAREEAIQEENEISRPHLAALQELLRKQCASALVDNKAPACMRVDFHTVIRTASKAAPDDHQLKRAATHAYKLLTDDPQGFLTVGDVARFKAHYNDSLVGPVIDAHLTKVGFCTLPLAHLTRVASIIEAAGGTQEAYNKAIQEFGLGAAEPTAIRARAFIRSLLAQFGTDMPGELFGEERNLPKKLIKQPPKEQKGEQPAMKAGTDEEAEAAVVITSPITGEPLMLEIETLEQAEEEGELSLDGLMPVGQLEELEVTMPDPTDDEGGLLKIELAPESSEKEAVAPEGWEETIKKMKKHEEITNPWALAWWLESQGAEPGGKKESTRRRKFVVYAYEHGKRAEHPIDQFEALGMAAALRRLSSFGVKGQILAQPSTLADEAVIVLEPETKSYLTITISDEPPAAVEEEAPSVEEDAPLPEPAEIEERLMAGERVALRRAAIEINDDAEVVIESPEGDEKSMPLAELSEAIAEFLCMLQEKQGNFGVVARFKAVCASCNSSAEYPMGQQADDVRCGRCSYVTSTQEISRQFEAGAAGVCGYTLVSDVPGHNAREQLINAKRILIAIQKELPTSTGMLRKDSRLQVDLNEQDESALRRATKILEERYGLCVHAQSQTYVGPPAAPVETGSQAQQEEIEKQMEKAKPVTAQLAPESTPSPALATNLSPEEAEAARAALTHYRNKGMGPAEAVAAFLKDYAELLDRYGDETDFSRHMVEAEIMAIARDVWQKPAVLHTAELVSLTSSPLGEHSDTDDAVTMSLEAPVINDQVAPQGEFSDTSTEPGSDSRDPGDFGAGAPAAQHAGDEPPGTSLSDTEFEVDSSSGENDATRMMDEISKDAQAQEEYLQGMAERLEKHIQKSEEQLPYMRGREVADLRREIDEKKKELADLRSQLGSAK